MSGPPLGAVARARLLAIANAGRVECAANDLVADAREVLHAAAANEDDGVLLQVVADARDVGRDLDAGRQADARDLAQGRVRLLRRDRLDARAYAAARGGTLERRALRLGARGLATAPDQLLDRGHGSVVVAFLLSIVFKGFHHPSGKAGPAGPASRDMLTRAKTVPSGYPLIVLRCRTHPPGPGATAKATRHEQAPSTKRRVPHC